MAEDLSEDERCLSIISDELTEEVILEHLFNLSIQPYQYEPENSGTREPEEDQHHAANHDQRLHSTNW